jgi:hypothetical protein
MEKWVYSIMSLFYIYIDEACGDPVIQLVFHYSNSDFSEYKK